MQHFPLSFPFLSTKLPIYPSLLSILWTLLSLIVIAWMVVCITNIYCLYIPKNNLFSLHNVIYRFVFKLTVGTVQQISMLFPGKDHLSQSQIFSVAYSSLWMSSLCRVETLSTHLLCHYSWIKMHHELCSLPYWVVPNSLSSKKSMKLGFTSIYHMIIWDCFLVYIFLAHAFYI